MITGINLFKNVLRKHRKKEERYIRGRGNIEEEKEWRKRLR